MRCAQFCSNRKRKTCSEMDPSPRNRSSKSQPPAPLNVSSRQHQIHQQRNKAAGKSRDSLNSIGPKPVQSEVKTGGRHPQPHSANNTKLKHKCPFEGCPWRFATPYKLRRHIKSHTKETPYLCEECGRGFSVRYNLLMHIQTIHSQPHKYKCPIRGCKEAFHSQPRLNGHLRRIHKKDWKTLQPNDDTGSDGAKECCSSRTSSTSSIDSTQSQSRYECLECKRMCGSQSKLNAHMRTHSGEKRFKCAMQGCGKSFTSKDRLTKHLDTHKNSTSFSCPHENCNRIFLRQTHLKTHLKIHTQGHFVCPVLDCSQKFDSEAEYNEHLGTHISCGCKCPQPGCQQSFPSPKRLELHCRAVHSDLYEGKIPLLCEPPHLATQPHLSNSALPEEPPTVSFFSRPDILNYVPQIIENVDLPDLNFQDIEAALSERSEWSGEEVEQFLRNTIYLTEIEAKLTGGYESDSGYSTTPYDVSPITSTAPMQLSCGPISFQGSLSPVLTPVDPSPLLTNIPAITPSFPLSGATVQHIVPPESAGSNSNVGFFPNASCFNPTQDGFFPDQSCTTLIPQEYFSSSMDTKPNLSDPSTSSSLTISSEFTDLMWDMPIPHGRRSSDGLITTNFMADGTPKSTELYNMNRSMPDLGKLSNDPGSPFTPSQNLPPQNEACLVKSESKRNSCVYASTSENSSSLVLPSPPTVEAPKPDDSENLQLPTNLSSSVTNLPGNNLQSLLSICSQMPALSKLLASSNNPTVFLVAISTALSTLTRPFLANGEPVPDASNSQGLAMVTGKDGQIDIAQLQSLVSKLGPTQLEQLLKSKTEVLPQLAHPKPIERTVIARVLQSPQASQANSQATPDEMDAQDIEESRPGSGKNQKPRMHKTGNPVAMKRKKKQQWPRSMNKASLIAFREHILNKLKKGQECNGVAGNSENVATKGEAPYELKVTCERNHSIEARCQSEPAHSSLSHSPAWSLQSSQSEGNIATEIPQLSDLLQGTNCVDLFDFSFNPDSLLSSSSFPEDLFDGLTNPVSGGCNHIAGDSMEDEELNQLLLGDNTSRLQGQDSIDMDCISDLLSEAQRTIADSPASVLENDHLPAPSGYQQLMGSPVTSSPATSNSGTPVASESHNVASERSSSSGSTAPTFTFPVVHGIMNGMTSSADESCLRLHIQQNLHSILRTHRDPLLAGNTCSSEPFEF